MNASYRFIVLVAALVVIVGGIANAQIKSAQTGNWGDASTWIGGVVPGPADNVQVDTPHVVTVVGNSAVCNDLVVKGYVYMDGTSTDNSLTINGSVTVDSTGRFRSSGITPAALRVQHITVKKNLTVYTGGSFDMRVGSNPNPSVGRIIFAGSTDSEISFPSKTYSSSNGEFNSVIVNKTGGAKVKVVNGYVFQNNNSTTAPDTLVLISGIIETSDTTAWVHLATSNNAVQGASSASYVNGWLGRGISNTGTPPITRNFEIGDANGYRKLTVRTQDVGGTTGHYVLARAYAGNANTGSSTLVGGIDKVSAGRYYKVGYFPTATLTMPIDLFIPEYQAEDGVGPGNWDLRVAYSTDGRATWTGMGQTVNDTTFVPDNAIRPDSLPSGSRVNLTSSTVVYVALARATGTTTNTLVYTTSVEQIDATPQEWSLQQNYPNPFNPSTEIRFTMPQSGKATLKVYSLLGQEVTTLVNGVREAGTHVATWNGLDASGRAMPSGVYLYRLESSSRVEMKKMVLMK
jgi:hypothetical protein